MARIRTYKPDFWTDPKVVSMSMSARMLLLGIFSFADDAGRMEHNALRLKMQVFPAEPFTAHEIEKMVGEMLNQALIELYVIDDRTYLQVCRWAEWQKIEKPTASRIPPNPSTKRIQPVEASPSTPRMVGEYSSTEEEEEEEEEKEKDNITHSLAHVHVKSKNQTATPQPPTETTKMSAVSQKNFEDDALTSQVVAFAAEHQGLLRDWVKEANVADVVREKGGIANVVREFCTHYIWKAQEPQSARFRGNPLDFFRANFRAWLMRENDFRPKSTPKNGGKSPPYRAGNAIQYPLDEAQVIAAFQGKYGTGVYSQLSRREIDRLCAAKNATEFEVWSEGMYNRYKSGNTMPGATRTGPIALSDTRSLQNKTVTQTIDGKCTP